jgi:Spy/CpxP family protein refolding chaperone
MTREGDFLMSAFRTAMCWPALGVVLALAGVGCSGHAGAPGVASTSQEEVAQQAATPAAAAPAEARHHHAPRGPDFLLHAALHESIGLTDAQRSSIQQLETSAHPAQPHTFDQARASALAAAVRAGKVDTTAFAAQGPTDADQSAWRASAAKSLDALHGILTADQRTALVAAITNHEAKHRSMDMADRDGRHANAQRMPMGHLLEGLSLTQSQLDAIHAAFQANKPSDADRASMKAAFESMRADRAAKLQSFASESFDSTAFLAPPAGAPALAPKEHVDHMAKDLAIVVPLLDANQREQLAQRIEAGPPRPPTPALPLPQ